MRLGNDVLDCVIFFYASEEDARSGNDPVGTGFVVWTTDGDRTRTHVYFVTCEHIVRASAPLHFVRWNDRESGTLIASTSNLDWVPHPRGDDLSACYIGLDPHLSGPSYAATSEFITREDVGVEVDLGSDCLMVGCFAPHPGCAKNVPVVRFGNVSMKPGEPVYVKARNFHQECFLVEMRSRGGFSGSPVYLLPEPMAEPRHLRQTLGLCCGHILDIDATTGVAANSGMAIVIPAWKIAELINCEELREGRKQQEVERDERRARGDYRWESALRPITK